MLRLLLEMRSPKCPPDVQRCLDAFNRSERERLLPFFRRLKARIFFSCLGLLIVGIWVAAFLWEAMR